MTLTHTYAEKASRPQTVSTLINDRQGVGCSSRGACNVYKMALVQEQIAFKVAVNTIVPRSPFFLFLYLKTQTVTHIRKNAVEYLRQWNGAICVIYNLCQRQKIR